MSSHGSSKRPNVTAPVGQQKNVYPMDKKEHIYFNPFVSASAQRRRVDAQPNVFPAPHKLNSFHVNYTPHVNVPNATFNQDHSTDDDEEVIMYPRINSSRNPPPSDNHTVKLHSPKPKVAAGYHSMRNNIIGYQEPAMPSRSTTSGSAQSRVPDLAGGVNAVCGSGGKGPNGHGHSQTDAKQTRKAKEVCISCGKSTYMYQNTLICVMADCREREARLEELFHATGAMRRAPRSKRRAKAPK